MVTARDVVHDLWTHLDLPPFPQSALRLTGPAHTLPSSYQLSLLPPAAIGATALAASLVRSHRLDSSELSPVSVDGLHAAVEFRSEAFTSLNGAPPPNLWGPISGVYPTADNGFVGIHANFPNHAAAALRILGLPECCTDKSAVAAAVEQFDAIELETLAAENDAVIYALRDPAAWNALPAAVALPSFPITIRKIRDAPPGLPPSLQGVENPTSCLQGLRVAELSRVIAGPIAGRALAAHGADVLWLHGPHLPSLPALDIDTSRGKRSAFIDLRDDVGKATLRSLLSSADVFIQSFRPGAIAAKGFDALSVAELNPDGIIYASLDAFGQEGPWSHRRGFDSMVQLCTGINASEAAHHNSGEPYKKWPVQALDHTAGYFLALGILTALHRRITIGGSWEVHVSLAAVAKYISSLPRLPGREGFDGAVGVTNDTARPFLETRETNFGELTAVRHAGQVDGATVGYRHQPTALGNHDARWEKSPLLTSRTS
ncbi:hypothetical protein Dda_5400 [Drechslerella dactyloides]|uniref:CoA-transferase family III n=1 Tax=Drechslerella dactyloides TaxID=74499 RepID=A0AAD6IW09_DREDA|nr:hypothetical protein Dda_5400 [Drechslerella dactyloides]